MQIIGEYFDVESDVSLSVVADVDTKKLSLAIRNIVSNAIKYTHRGGSVTVTSTYRPSPAPSLDPVAPSARGQPGAGPSSGVLRIEVRDTGSGIPLSRQEAIFNGGGDLNLEKDAGGCLGLWCKYNIVLYYMYCNVYTHIYIYLFAY
jgi:signal transduction histidine kinase